MKSRVEFDLSEFLRLLDNLLAFAPAILSQTAQPIDQVLRQTIYSNNSLFFRKSDAFLYAFPDSMITSHTTHFTTVVYPVLGPPLMTSTHA